MKYIIIPARLNSTRLPGKLLLDTSKQRKKVIDRAIDNALLAANYSDTKVVVVTDSASIMSYLRETCPNYISVIPSRRDHLNGTSRVFEAAQTLGLKYSDQIVNLQGDMAVIDPTAIESCLNGNPYEVHSAYYLSKFMHAQNPNQVKVITNRQGRAMYFSRSLIPYVKETNQGFQGYKIHVGIYGYSFSLLNKLMSKPQDNVTANTENLEQLHWLMNGKKIRMKKVKPCISIDTEDDLKRLAEYDTTNR
jgi:3-deoxy-manno-octulosonate cytidylyltransferase (CMP-KDO synthetase)